jgi:hypothetical protein
MTWPNHHNRPRPPRRLRRLGGFAAFLFMGAVLAAAQQQPNGAVQAGSTQAQDPGPSRPGAGATPLAVPAAQSAFRNFDAANAERTKQIAEDSAKLLQLATDLKAEVDKTDKDTLSVTVIRKADEIEKLARAVKEKMKLTMGAN